MNPFKTLILLLLFTLQLVANPATQIVDLRTDHLVNPIGVDNPNPRLSWKITADTKGFKQRAYQIIVDTDSMHVVNNIGETWDSGAINSDEQLIAYKGEELLPYTKYFWKVIVYDETEKSTSSSISSFETGLMGEHNWKGNWISDGRNIDTNLPPISERNLKHKKKFILQEFIWRLPDCMNCMSMVRK